MTRERESCKIPGNMAVKDLVGVLSQLAEQGKCLSLVEIAERLGGRVNGLLSVAIKMNLVGEAEKDGRMYYYPKADENALISRGVLSEELHVNISGLGSSTRVDQNDVSYSRWERLVGSNKRKAELVILEVLSERGFIDSGIES